MISITVGANAYNLVAMPATPGFAEVSFDMNDTVARNVSPFTRQTQTQIWSGADYWTAQVTMPPMSTDTADAWIAWLAELRGIANVFQLGDPDKPTPRGQAAGAPVVNSPTGDGYNLAMATTLYTRGWTPNRFGVLLPRDYVQIGYRLYMNLERANSDSSGTSALQIWPSLREAPPDGTQIVLHNTQALFRLAGNKRTWHKSPKTATQLGFMAMEVR